MLSKMVIICGVEKIGLCSNLSRKTPLVGCPWLRIQYTLSNPTNCHSSTIQCAWKLDVSKSRWEHMPKELTVNLG